MSKRSAAATAPVNIGLSPGEAHLLLESVRDYGIFMIDPEGRVASWNAGAERVHGHTAAEIVGEHVSRLFLPEDVAEGKPERELAIAAKEGRAEDEGLRLRKDGSSFWAETVTAAIRDERGALIGFAKVTRDVTVRRQTERALRLSEQRFHDLVDAVTDYAIFMLDESGRVTTWNEGARRIKGYSESEIVGRHFSIFYTPEDRAAGLPERVLEAVRRDGRLEHQGWRVRKDGVRLWADVVITALRDEAGRVTGFVKVTRDLTERRAAEQELRRAEQRFHQLVEAANEYAIFMLDATGHVATWNSGARRTKGYTEEEILGKHFSIFYPAEDRAAGKPERILDTVRREGHYEEEGWRVRKDGTRFWANVVINVLRDERGEVTGFAKVTRDLSHRREAEERLRRSEERFRLLVDGVSDYAIYMLDVDGRVTSWNRGAERMKGYAPSEILGREFSVFFPPEDIRMGKPSRELAVAVANGRFEDEGWRVRKDGTRFWANVVLTPLRDAHGVLVGFAKVTRDLTSRREAEETERRLIREQAARAAAEESERRLRDSEQAATEAAVRALDAARRAEAANRVKDEFLATVSHELRTPLNAILGWSKLLRDGADRALWPKAIDVIHRNAEAQSRLVEDILDTSRIITGKLRLDVRRVDLMQLVREAIEVVRPSALAKRITIELHCDREDGALLGDAERLRQVAWNLLSNAVKFTEPGGVVEVSLRHEGTSLQLAVRDTGRGIEPEFLPFVFERFKQADSSTTRRYGGLGLGLAIVRHIVELHGGQVRAESAGPGAGARFTVTLPVRAADEEVEAEEREEQASAPQAYEPAPALLTGVRVLVVDDDADARELLQLALAAAGAEVETTPSAAAGFDAIRRFRPDVLVSDIGMPQEDGYSFVRRVRTLDRAEGGGIPTIALTAYTRSEDRTRALAAGFTSHVGKPVNPRDLIAAIANVVAVTRR